MGGGEGEVEGDGLVGVVAEHDGLELGVAGAEVGEVQGGWGD